MFNMVHNCLKWRESFIFVKDDANEASKSKRVNSEGTKFPQSGVPPQAHHHEKEVRDVTRVKHENERPIEELEPRVDHQYH